MDITQIRRIRRMEDALNEVIPAAQALEESLDRFQSVLPRLRVLAAYYESEQWRRDYDDDAAGLLPADLPRGVLAQDTVYDLLSDVEHLREAMEALCERLRPEAD